MPPPNITGKLHLGHSLFLTLQDILIRYHRMNGENTLWLPGTDHAGIATDLKIQEYFKSQNHTPTKDEFISKAWEWKEDFHHTITTQIKAMGASCDWSRERFTLDSDYLKSSTAALQLCNEQGLLYRKEGQWYLDMTHLAKELLSAIEDNTIAINIEGSKNTLIHFLKNIEPWCISRQIQWGQQIPIFYNINNKSEYYIAHTLEGACFSSNLEPNQLIQETDTLDTWFLSSLWPFATLGWPNKTQDYNTYYPSNIIETADDILFFWCARMLMMGKLCTDQWAFKTIYLHGIIRDKNGNKMSKSLGNGINPLDLIEEYGTDALRWTLAFHNTIDTDPKIDIQDFKTSYKLMNKIWQAGRFIINHCDRLEISKSDYGKISWQPIMDFKDRYHQLLDNEQFLTASTELYHLFKNEFCDKWIEENKRAIYDDNKEILIEGLCIYRQLLKYLHPFIPFITEKLWGELSDSELIGERVM